MEGRTPYWDLKRQCIFDLLDKFPDSPSRELARILYRDNPELFKDFEEARNRIRYYRGKCGKKLREIVKIRKYYKD
jgi:hypothetical protein